MKNVTMKNSKKVATEKQMKFAETILQKINSELAVAAVAFPDVAEFAAEQLDALTSARFGGAFDVIDFLKSKNVAMELYYAARNKNNSAAVSHFTKLLPR